MSASNHVKTRKAPARQKQATKVEHIADAWAVDEARETGMTLVPSICGMKLLPVLPRYTIVTRDAAVEQSPTRRRVCKRCLTVLDKWQRIDDNNVIRKMETQFLGGDHD